MYDEMFQDVLEQVGFDLLQNDLPVRAAFGYLYLSRNEQMYEKFKQLAYSIQLHHFDEWLGESGE